MQLNRKLAMKTLALLVLCAVTAFAVSESGTVPKEVKSFIVDRDICNHFRSEPFEGGSPEQIVRREFIADRLDIYCSGSDKRFSALNRRYKNNRAAMTKLNQYEERIEGSKSN